MRATVTVSVSILIVCLLPTGESYTAPTPSEAPIDWELTFEYRDLQCVQLHVPGEPKRRLFWYLRYQVTNQTGKDEIYIPSFSLYTETGQLIPAGQNVSIFVFDHIKNLLNDPFLKNVSAMTGKLLEGKDNAKDSIAVFQDFDPAAGTVDLFVGGLSGETTEIELPRPVRVLEMDTTGDIKEVVKEKIVLSKTLQLRYSIPGEAAARLHAPVAMKEKKWIMR